MSPTHGESAGQFAAADRLLHSRTARCRHRSIRDTHRPSCHAQSVITHHPHYHHHQILFGLYCFPRSFLSLCDHDNSWTAPSVSDLKLTCWRNPFSDYSLDWTSPNLPLVDVAVVCITWATLKIPDWLIDWLMFHKHYFLHQQITIT